MTRGGRDKASFTEPRRTRPPDSDLELDRLRARVEQLSQLLALLPAAAATAGDTVAVRPPMPPGGNAAIEAAMAWAVPVQEALSWPAISVPDEALTPPAGFAAQSLSSTAVPTLAVHVFGLAGDALAKIVAMVAKRQQQSRDFRPVFLTDSADLSVFRRHGFACEHFPPALYGRADRTPRFARRARLTFLQRKWAFAGTLDLSAGSKPLRDPKAAPPAAGAGTPAKDGTRDIIASVRLIRESGLFDEAWYLATYPDAAGRDPIRHYLEIGAANGHDPSPVFRTAFYVRQLMRMGGPKAE